MLEADHLDTANLTAIINPIIMGPPNLRVEVKRGYEIKSGLTSTTARQLAPEDAQITQIVGFEGASLTSDNTVTIKTKWLDHEGRALPQSLAGAGYTGRVAILSDNQTLPNDNQGVYQFSIDPGERVQVLQLPNAITDSEHFYIHISGEPRSGNPIFAGNAIYPGIDVSDQRCYPARIFCSTPVGYD